MTPEAGRVIRAAGRPLAGAPEDYDELLTLVGDARLVLLGEASHGTHEFYRERAAISRRLIVEKGFAAIAVEADWPNAYRVNRYVRGVGGDRNAEEALREFQRFPAWMWRNADVVQFLEWLRSFNGERAERLRVGFYGLDLYSLHASIRAVLAYLVKVDPDGARRARERYSCFDHYGDDSQAYGYAATFGLSESCERAVIEQLVDLRRQAAEYASRDGRVARDEYFFAEQNARLVKSAEKYYRSMFEARVASWNLRDTHMAETLERLIAFLNKDRPDTKLVVWAHNSHLGDARATEMGQAGELNLGQLARERFGGDARSIGFTTYEGTVTAAADWDGPTELKRVRPALPGSYEALFHDTAMPAFFLDLQQGVAREALRGPRLERAIGVIYRPESERTSHYFHASLPEQFDAVLHFDHTSAVRPLDRSRLWNREDAPETFPSGV